MKAPPEALRHIERIEYELAQLRAMFGFESKDAPRKEARPMFGCDRCWTAFFSLAELDSHTVDRHPGSVLTR